MIAMSQPPPMPMQQPVPMQQQVPMPMPAPVPQPPIPRAALDHPVLYNPGPAVARWHALKRRRTGRFVSLGISVAIWAAIWWFTRDDLWEGFWWLAGISVGITVLGIVWGFLRVFWARRDVGRLHEGLALGVGRGGLYLHDTYLPWTEVAGLDAKPGRLDGSARLVVRTASGAKLELPLDYLGQTPSALDGAVRALSGGRSWIELGALDE